MTDFLNLKGEPLQLVCEVCVCVCVLLSLLSFLLSLSLSQLSFSLWSRGWTNWRSPPHLQVWSSQESE